MSHPLEAFPRAPATCIWEITRACNLRCIHCENRCGERSAEELPLSTIEQTLDELATLGCRVVDVSGGEPLLRPDWDEICAAITRRSMRAALITNGTLLDDAAIERALAAGVGTVAVSLDGMQAAHDSMRARPAPGPSPWQQAVDGLGRARGHLETVVITQVNRRTLGDLQAMHAFLADQGVARWQVQLTVPVGRVRDLHEPLVLHPRDLEPLTAFIAETNRAGVAPAIDTSDSIGYCTDREPLLRPRARGTGVWLGCLAGLRVVAITYDGRVRGCSALPPDFDAGDLHQEAISSIWTDAERFGYSTRFDPGNLTGGCARCRVGSLCRAGCTTMAWWVGGTVHDNAYCLRRVRETS